MEAIEIKINGWVWWFKDNHILENKDSKIGIYLYSKHITKNEREQIKYQLFNLNNLVE